MIVTEILEQQTTIEYMNVGDLHIDRTYQRDVSLAKVKLISENFNTAAAGVLIVNIRDDEQAYLMDGQNRLEAMKKRGIWLVQCKVCRGLTVEQEAEVYIYCNTARKNPNALDTFRARLVRKDPVAITIEKVVDKCGLSIQFSFQGNSHGKRISPKFIWAVNALEDIYQRGKANGKDGEKLLEEVLSLVSQSWPEGTEAMKSYILLGVTAFHLKYKGRYSREEFIAKMHVTDFKFLTKRSQYHAEIGGGSIHTAFAKALQEAYDKGKKTRRLESK